MFCEAIRNSACAHHKNKLYDWSSKVHNMVMSSSGDWFGIMV